MITPTETNKDYSRKAIKSRMLNLASEEHGYDPSEYGQFDPLVDLLISALSKELEKSHQYFEQCLEEMADLVVERLLPNSDIDFNPSISVAKVYPKAAGKI